MADAEDALKRARNALAEKCAKDELLSAQRMLNRAKQFMDEGKYDEAKSAFDAAKKLAEKARQEALDNKDECLKKKRKALPAGPKPPNIAITSENPTTDNREKLDTIYFAFNQNSLTEKAKRILQKHAEWLRKNKNVKVEIAGHCDQRGSVEYNLALGERRAITARNFLVNLGIAKSRLLIISYGHQRPADHRNTLEAYAKNRRAEFRVTK